MMTRAGALVAAALLLAAAFLASAQCPQDGMMVDCFGHGTCNVDVCECDSGWGYGYADDDCSVPVTVLPSVTNATMEVTLVGQSHAFFEYTSPTNPTGNPWNYFLTAESGGGSCSSVDLYTKFWCGTPPAYPLPGYQFGDFDDSDTSEPVDVEYYHTENAEPATCSPEMPSTYWMLLRRTSSSSLCNATARIYVEDACSNHGTWDSGNEVCACDPGYAFHDCSLPATIVTGVASFESVETIVGAGYRYYQFTSPANPRSNPWNYVASISTGGPSCSLGLYSNWFCMAADPYPFPGFVSAEYEDSDTSSPYLIDYFHDDSSGPAACATMPDTYYFAVRRTSTSSYCDLNVTIEAIDACSNNGNWDDVNEVCVCDPGYAFHDCSLPATIVTGVASFESVETIVEAGYRFYQFTAPTNPRSNPWNYVASISTGGPSCSLSLYSNWFCMAADPYPFPGFSFGEYEDSDTSSPYLIDYFHDDSSGPAACATMPDTYYFAVRRTSTSSYCDFNVTIEATDACSNNGNWDGVNEECVCDAGWAHSDCSIPVLTVTDAEVTVVNETMVGAEIRYYAWTAPTNPTGNPYDFIFSAELVGASGSITVYTNYFCTTPAPYPFPGFNFGDYQDSDSDNFAVVDYEYSDTNGPAACATRPDTYYVAVRRTSTSPPVVVRVTLEARDVCSSNGAWDDVLKWCVCDVGWAGEDCGRPLTNSTGVFSATFNGTVVGANRDYYSFRPPAAVNPLGYTFAFDDVADACGTAYLTIRYWCGTPDAFPFPTSSSAGYFERLSSFNGDSQTTVPPTENWASNTPDGNCDGLETPDVWFVMIDRTTSSGSCDYALTMSAADGCFNHGHYNEADDRCECFAGWAGEFCTDTVGTLALDVPVAVAWSGSGEYGHYQYLNQNDTVGMDVTFTFDTTCPNYDIEIEVVAVCAGDTECAYNPFPDQVGYNFRHTQAFPVDIAYSVEDNTNKCSCNPPAPRDYFVYIAMTDTTPCTWTLTVSEESHCNGRGVVIYTADGAECQCDDGYAGVLCEFAAETIVNGGTDAFLLYMSPDSLQYFYAEPPSYAAHPVLFTTRASGTCDFRAYANYDCGASANPFPYRTQNNYFSMGNYENSASTNGGSSTRTYINFFDVGVNDESDHGCESDVSSLAYYFAVAMYGTPSTNCTFESELGFEPVCPSSDQGVCNGVGACSALASCNCGTPEDPEDLWTGFDCTLPYRWWVTAADEAEETNSFGSLKRFEFLATQVGSDEDDGGDEGDEREFFVPDPSITEIFNGRDQDYRVAPSVATHHWLAVSGSNDEIILTFTVPFGLSSEADAHLIYGRFKAPSNVSVSTTVVGKQMVVAVDETGAAFDFRLNISAAAASDEDTFSFVMNKTFLASKFEDNSELFIMSVPVGAWVYPVKSCFSSDPDCAIPISLSGSSTIYDQRETMTVAVSISDGLGLLFDVVGLLLAIVVLAICCGVIKFKDWHKPVIEEVKQYFNGDFDDVKDVSTVGDDDTPPGEDGAVELTEVVTDETAVPVVPIVAPPPPGVPTTAYPGGPPIDVPVDDGSDAHDPDSARRPAYPGAPPGVYADDSDDDSPSKTQRALNAAKAGAPAVAGAVGGQVAGRMMVGGGGDAAAGAATAAAGGSTSGISPVGAAGAAAYKAGAAVAKRANSWWEYLLFGLLQLLFFLFGIAKTFFNVTLVHASVSISVSIPSLQPVKDAVKDFSGLFRIGFAFDDLFSFFSGLTSVGMDWNCSGFISLVTPFALTIMLCGVVAILYFDVILWARLGMEKHKDKFKFSGSKGGAIIFKGLSAALVSFLFYCLQTMVVMMTELIFGILTNEGRTCNSFDLLIQSNAKIVNIIVICVAVVALLFVFAGKPTRTFPDWGAWRYPIMVLDGIGRILLLTFGIWTTTTVKAFEITKKAEKFDDDPDDDDLKHSEVLETMGRSRGLIWLILPLFAIFTKCSEAFNSTPIGIFSDNLELNSSFKMRAIKFTFKAVHLIFILVTALAPTTGMLVVSVLAGFPLFFFNLVMDLMEFLGKAPCLK